MPPCRFAVLLVLASLVSQAAEAAPPTLDDYRHFRALTVDLLGRIPTRAEIAAFEAPGFDLEKWIDTQLARPAYVDRIARVYLDLLRLEVGPAVQFAPPASTLKRVQILGPDGKAEWVYFRTGQRRARELTDGDFCLHESESGLAFVSNNEVRGKPFAVRQALLDRYTVLLKPWWLYRDFDQANPHERLGEAWKPDALFQPVDELLKGPDGRPVVAVRVCREEAQTSETGRIFVSGRGPGRPDPREARIYGPPLPRRTRPAPPDDPFAKAHAGETLSCRSVLGLTMSIECGCGPGLSHCMPGDGTANDPRAFSFPARTPIGLDQPLASAPQPVSAWHKLWWAQEALHLLWRVLADDRDFREVVTARYTLVNGPLVQFYRSIASTGCCGRERAFGMLSETEPLVDPRKLPALGPADTRTWRLVPERGPHAAGILTTPAFLSKFASRRARAAVLYGAFLCKPFVAGKEPLAPSTEPNLMVRPGCASCHATLEPLAAYFARVEETGWTFLPEWQFPLRALQCKRNPRGKIPGYCEAFYDPAFSDEQGGMLRGAYGSVDHAAAGPVGAGAAIAAAPEFARCAVERVTASFLGRPLSDDDAPLLGTLTSTFVSHGYRMRALVSAIVRSDVYRRSNNLRTAAAR